MSLEELLAGLQPEDQPEFDWDAPEAGQFPPQVQPGPADFVFSLHKESSDNGDNPPYEQGFSSMTIEGKKYLAVLFDCEVVKKDGSTAHVNFQRVNSFKHPKVNQSSLQELLRSLGKRPDSNYPEIVRVLQEADGERVRAKGEVAWRSYCKVHEITISTHPRRRKVKSTGDKVKDTSWPKDAQGNFIPAVQCPKCDAGIKQFGREEFVTFYSAAAAANGQG